VPVLLLGPRGDRVARLQRNDLGAAVLGSALSLDDVEDLATAVLVPVGRGAGLEADKADADRLRVQLGVDQALVGIAGEVALWLAQVALHRLAATYDRHRKDNTDMKIEGSVALVTGGASGLGLATAELLASKGAKVVVVDLPRSAGEEVAGRLGGRFAAADVTSEEDVNRALDLAAELGQLRIAVNCAGIGSGGRVAGKEGPYPLDQFRRVLEVNLVGTFNVLSKAAFRIGAAEPVEGERGVIVNTASIAAFEGQIGQAAYTASKAAIHGLTIQTARDLASLQIRVCTIAPGLMDTPLLAGLRDDILEQLAASVPNPHRLGRPTEYAQLALQIIENAYLNGETIRLDGALRMAPR
jgi:NAD(P)-dependent dehydrogenase (short-subunit alcohol dehydrogenase family)